MITFSSIAAVLIGYLLRHWDPLKAHAPLDPLAAALKATTEAQQQAAIAEALARLQKTGTARKTS